MLIEVADTLRNKSDSGIVTVYGVVSHKASHALRPLLVCCASPPQL
jgi:hypothetical protein